VRFATVGHIYVGRRLVTEFSKKCFLGLWLLFALTTIGAPADEDAVTSGQKWLSLVDDQKYEESWNQASSMFRREVTQERWVTALKRSRDPLGPVVSRTRSRLEFSKFLRGAPEGEYAIVHFTTSFTSKNATERLTLLKEDGKWQMAAYGIY
jgi:Protein of unknown function (DUF4019)